jgi:large subunit ribosomal protein L28
VNIDYCLPNYLIILYKNSIYKRIIIMSRRCTVTGKAVMTGNNVSHANNRTKRRFLPNVQITGVFSEALKKLVRIKISANGLRTLEHKGGLDAYLLDTAPTKLDPDLLKIRKQIVDAKERQAA